MKTIRKALVSGLIGLVVFGLLLFVPAGTFNYWQAWVFLVMILATWIPSIYLVRANHTVLQRRMRGGPVAETRTVQKVVIAGWYLSMTAISWSAPLTIVLAGRRYQWQSAWLVMFW